MVPPFDVHTSWELPSVETCDLLLVHSHLAKAKEFCRCKSKGSVLDGPDLIRYWALPEVRDFLDYF